MIFHANGKFLLTGEYFVLDGARALAMPLKRGQCMEVKNTGREGLRWISLDEQNITWFEGYFSLPDFEALRTTDPEISTRLQQVFQSVRQQQPNFWKENPVSDVRTRLEFPREWGLGTSSTVLSLIAQWSETDPYQLLRSSFGGSGYDIACATASGPIIYQLADANPVVKSVPFRPTFRDQLYFVYLNKKQNSRQAIRRYREQVRTDSGLVKKISELTDAFIAVTTLDDFNSLIKDHEQLVAKVLGLKRAKELHFSDWPGEVKSLGAWGGDFVLISSPYNDTDTRKYFIEKGFEVVIEYNELVL